MCACGLTRMRWRWAEVQEGRYPGGRDWLVLEQGVRAASVDCLTRCMEGMKILPRYTGNINARRKPFGKVGSSVVEGQCGAELTAPRSS